MTNINVQAIIGLCIATAFFRNGWHNETTLAEVDEENGFDSIIESAASYGNWVGIKMPTLTRSDVIESIWGDLDDET